MVVDDEAIITMQLKEHLTAMGYNVVGIGSSGEEAVKLSKKLQPNLILMDIVMGGKKDGIDAAEIIQKNLEIPIIFITAFGEEHFLERAKVLEPYGYIMKPLRKQEIKSAIEIALYKAQMQQRLKESEGRFNAMLQAIGDHVNMMDIDLNLIWANEATKKTFGDDIVGKKCYSVFYQRKKPCKPFPCHVVRTFRTGEVHHQETKCVNNDGQSVTYYCTSNVALGDGSGKPKAVIEVCQNISEHIRLKRELQKSRDQLERKVIERTRELETKTKRLEEVNTALKVLLNKRQEDKKELEDNVLTNVKSLVLPYIEKMYKTRLDEQQKTFIDIIETNIDEIISPFYKNLILRYSSLTPTELNITSLIKDGNTTKQIAKILNISPKTVDTHRKNIRRKIGIENKKINLRSHLLNLH
jgi:DNA-binding NarL/FixJ family response regulator